MIFMHIPFHSVRFHSIANWSWCTQFTNQTITVLGNPLRMKFFQPKISLIMVSIMFVLFVRYFVRMLYFNSIFCLMSSLSLKSRFLFGNHRESPRITWWFQILITLQQIKPDCERVCVCLLLCVWDLRHIWLAKVSRKDLNEYAWREMKWREKWLNENRLVTQNKCKPFIWFVKILMWKDYKRCRLLTIDRSRQ